MSNEQNEQIKQEILKAFVFEGDCEITKKANDTFYTIKPKKDDKQNEDKILIKKIENNKIFDKYNLSFENCVFECELLFNDENFKKRFRFEKCTFKEQVHFEYITFNDIVYFLDSTFEKEADFSRSRFKERAFFSHSNFKNASFEEVIFDNNAYFDEAKFLGEANFKQSEFYENAYFYGTNFEIFPNFIQALFNKNVNFTNTDLIFDFDGTKDKIERTYDIKNTEEQKYKIANDFRDSFRSIKSSLIEKHNMLDASNHHKMELYCKELELEHKRKEKAKGFWENLKFLLNNGKDFVDEIQLYCYRITSDHHTNLLMILNNVIFLIALFGIMKCFLKHNYMSEALACIVFVIISISFLLCHKLTLEETCNKYSKIVNNNFVFILLYVIPAILLGYILFNYYASSACLSCVIFAIFILYAIFYNTIIEVITLAFAYLVSKKRNCILFLAYGMTTYMTFTTPTSILPILGKLIENKSGEACLLVIGKVKILCCSSAPSTPETLNLIYMLFLFLLLWSLQKTARKNTIVPN